MKFLVLFVATVAFASASLLTSKKVQITEDGTIVIQGENGKLVQIKKNGPYGERNIEIDVTGPNTPTKRIQIDNNNQVSIEKGVEYNIPTTNVGYTDQKYKRSSTDEVLNGHMGSIDENSYQALIEKVQKAGLNGDVDTKDLNVWKALIGDHTFDNKISGQDRYNEGMTQQKYGFELQSLNGNDMQYVYNVLFKIFDKEVLRTVLEQLQIQGLDYSDQKSIDGLWDTVFSHLGIFDHQLLVKIINDKFLRNYFIARGFFDKVVLDQILYAYKTDGVYDQYLLQRLFNTKVLKHFFVIHGISVYDVLGKSLHNQYYGKLFGKQGIYGQDYNQYDAEYFYNVLMKIFDRQVLKTILMQQKMDNQEIFDQYSYEKVWDMVFAHEGIFDHKFLVEIINNKVLRNYFVQYGFFDKAVLEKIVVAYKTGGAFDQSLLQHLVNTQVLKTFFIIHKISVYDILKQNLYYGNNFYNKGVYGYNSLEKFISQPIYRDILVRYGVFNKNILDQILYRYNTQGVYDQELLRQLVNKQALYSILTQYGIVDQTVLRQYIANEFLALNFLYKNNFFQQTPRIIRSYSQTFGYGISPEFSQNTQVYPYGGSYLRNIMYGPNYYGLNRGYNKGFYGKYFHQYPTTEELSY